MFSQEGVPQTHESVCQLLQNTGICQLLVGHFIFRAIHQKESNVPIWLLMFSRVV